MDECGAKERSRAVAERQAGRIAWWQMAALGLGRGMIEGWIDAQRLIPELPRVYALGHAARSRAGALWAAILYAGPGAMLSHRTAAHWRELIDYPPATIEVSSPRRVRSLPDVRVYGQRHLVRAIHKGMPVTSLTQAVLDLAAGAEFPLVRKALARLDYRHQLDVKALRAICRHGRPGSAALRKALAIHQPRLAHLNGPLEYDFFAWCERWGVPLPLVNVWVHGILVDAYWPDHGLVVELDGADNHSSPAQRRRDHANDMTLRGHGLTVLRYDWSVVHDAPRSVYADLIAALTRSAR
jgi:hypothetical protein